MELRKPKTNIVLMCLLCISLIGYVIAATTTTVEGQVQPSWQLLRAEADEDASGIDLTTGGDYASMPDGAIELPGDATAGLSKKISFITCAGAAADKTYTVAYYGYMKDNGPAQRIMSVDYTTGTQAVVKYPDTAAAATDKFWSDTATVTSYRSALAGKNDCEGNNGVAEVVIYSGGFNKIWSEVSGADGVTGDEAGDVSVYYCIRN